METFQAVDHSDGGVVVLSLAISYRDIELMAERGVKVDHSTVNRWVIGKSGTNKATLDSLNLQLALLFLMAGIFMPRYKSIWGSSDIERRIKNRNW